jgi:hypothetical protein
MIRPRAMGFGAALLILAGTAAAQEMEEEPTTMGMAPSMAAMGGAMGMAPSMMATRMAPPEAAQARMEARAAAMAAMDTGMAGSMAPEEPPGQARAAQAREAAAARAAARATPRPGPSAEAVTSRRRARWNRLRGQIDAESPSAIAPPIRAELRAHARRVAKLQRIAIVATDAGDTDAVTRAQTLLQRANARHERRLAQLAGGGSLPAPAAEAADENAAAMAASPMAAMRPSPMAAAMRPSPMAAMRPSPMTNMASPMAATAMEGE